MPIDPDCLSWTDSNAAAAAMGAGTSGFSGQEG